MPRLCPQPASTAALLAAVALALAACSSGSPGPSATPSGSTGWHRVTATPKGGYALTDVVAGGPGLAAVGTGGLTGPGISWLSTDGLSWTEGPAADALATIPLAAVAATDAGLVALGVGQGTQAASAPLTGAWTVDPSVQSGSAPGDVQGNPEQIAAGGPRLVAVGSAHADETVNGTSVAVDLARVWTSTDGLSWTSVPFGPTFDKAEMLSVIYAKGEYVVAGTTQLLGGLDALGHETTSGHDACVWTSTDGLTWNRESDGPAFADATMLALTAGGPGFVAVGYGAKGAAVWTSPDAVTWTRVPDSPTFAGAKMYGVAAGSSGLVAVGYDSAGALIWRSSDGTDWTRVAGGADFAEAQALSVAALGDTFVAVGQASPAGDAQAYIWVGP